MTKEQLLKKFKNISLRDFNTETIILLAYDAGVKSCLKEDIKTCNVNECKIYCLKNKKHYNCIAGVCGRRNIFKDAMVIEGRCNNCKYFCEESKNCHATECPYIDGEV